MRQPPHWLGALSHIPNPPQEFEGNQIWLQTLASGEVEAPSALSFSLLKKNLDRESHQLLHSHAFEEDNVGHELHKMLWGILGRRCRASEFGRRNLELP